MSRGDLTLGAAEEHIEGVLIAQEVEINQARRFISFLIAVARGQCVDSLGLLQGILDWENTEIASYAYEVSGAMQQWGVKGTLQRVLSGKDLR